ncbi:MAG TPA: acyltransferase [Roseomonas sp.]
MAEGPPRIAFAHGLRGLAALSVLLSHYTEHFWNYRGGAADFLGVPDWRGPAPAILAVHHWLPEGFAGHFGVALFFLISGFVIPFSLIGRGRAGFAAGRVLRIWPTYAAGLLVTMLAVWACARHFGNPLPFGITQVVAQLLFVRDLLGLPTIDGIVWTLEIEVRFYLLCLLIAPSLRAGRVRPVLATGLALTGFFAVAGVIPLPLPWQVALGELALSGQMITFMLVGAVFGARHRGTEGGAACLWAGAFLLALFALQWAGGVMGGRLVPGLVAYGVALLLFGGLFALRGRLRRVPGPIDALARISYPLYVVHGVAGYAVMRVLLEAGWPAMAAILIATTLALAVATLLHRLVEVPTQRAAHWLGRR